MKEKILLIGAGTIYKRKKRSLPLWLIVKPNKDSGWELPKTHARGGESSVRSVIRMATEQAGMRAKVLEESGRANSSTQVNGKTLQQRTIFYLMICKDHGELIGWHETDWVPYAKLAKKLTFKRELAAVKHAKEILTQLEKSKELKKREEDPEPLIEGDVA